MAAQALGPRVKEHQARGGDGRRGSGATTWAHRKRSWAAVPPGPVPDMGRRKGGLKM